MGIPLPQTLVALLNKRESIKVLTSLDQAGIPNTVFKDSIHADTDGNIRYLELLETSITNRNLIYSLWFSRPVTINVLSEDRKSWQIRGIPVKSLICGVEFQDAYYAVQQTLGKDTNLSAIWIIEPREIREESLTVRQREQTEAYPLVGHLDRYVTCGTGKK
jgi:hypothetical protein